jgi:hypothetical protein
MLMSGYAGAEPSAEAEPVTDMAFIQKPYQPQDLVQKVRAVLRDRG